MIFNTQILEQAVEDIALIKKMLLDSQQKPWLTSQELATYLGYSTDYIYKIKEKYFIEGIHFHKKVGKIIYDRIAVDEWVVSDNKGTNHDTNQSKRQVVDNILSSINKVQKKPKS
jgi:hypothetical protein